MKTRLCLPAAAGIGSLFAAAALASVPAEVVGGGHDPDWPCIQRKVPELSAAAVWQGPPIEEALENWREDAEVVALVEELAARRTPMDEAKAAVADFAAKLAPGDRERRLTLVFAGVLASLDNERNEVMSGIERYARKQKEMAEQIRGDQARLSELGSAPEADAERVGELNNRLVWETRIFEERRQSLSFVCEVPTLIEQRLFELARAIQSELPT
jgi:hypothetical protein